MKDFARTLQTAADAEGIAKLLERAARGLTTRMEDQRLDALAQRYRDYAAALRETAAEEPTELAPDQAVLI